MDKKYEVVNIYRIYDANRVFLIALYSDKLEYFKVARSMSDKIAQGYVYIGDFVRITHSKPEGIVFTIDTCEDEHIDDAKEQVSILYSIGEKIQGGNIDKAMNYLPYLCDVLPYSKKPVASIEATPIYVNKLFQGKYLIGNVEVSNLLLPIPNHFIARIQQKTRINMYPNTYNPFFFIIASSGNTSVKLIFWLESLKSYSNLKVGDILYVKEYKNKKKLPFIDRIEYNTFTESVYFYCEEITCKDLLRIDSKNKGYVKPIFDTISGRINYISILMRHSFNSCLMEYVMCRIEDKSVLLFYNSDDEFYNLRDGTRVKISELRRVVRAGFEFFVSSIYTQFEIFADDNEDTGKKQQFVSIFGAIGYIPDWFSSLSDVTEYTEIEKIRGHDVSVNLFMKPILTSIEELRQVNLVLNEVKKFVIQSTILNFSEDELTIDYSENNIKKKQKSWKVVIEDNFCCFAFENYFFDQKLRLKNSNEELYDIKDLIGRKLYLFVESMRVDINTIIYILTGITDK